MVECKFVSLGEGCSDDSEGCEQLQIAEVAEKGFR